MPRREHSWLRTSARESSSCRHSSVATCRTGCVWMAEHAVVVCTRDRPQLLGGLLPALVSEAASGVEVVVVDSASQGRETAELVESAGLRLVRCDRPGASYARNVGLAATSAPVVVFTDDDCRPRL